MIADKLQYLRPAFDAELATAGAQALIAMSPEGFLHAAGVHVPSQTMIRERLAFAVFVAGGEPFAVVSSVVARTVARDSWIDDVTAWAEHEETPVAGLVRQLRERGLADGTLALETGYLPAASFAELQEALPDVTWADADPLLARTRMVKTAGEIELMRRNALAAERAIWAGFMFSRAGTTEREIARRMVGALIDVGGDSSPFMSLAAGAEHTQELHAVPGAYELRPGDTVAVDMVGTFRGYYTDYARMAVVGPPSEAQRRAWQTVVDVQTQLLDDIVPGAIAEDVFQRAQRYAEQLGTPLGTNLVGHSLGIGLHEHPVLAPGCRETLAAGMTLCVEVLIVDRELGRFHVEDLVEVREAAAARRLTTYFDTAELHRIEP
jgi:Xaa-Pro aminopeptidase